MLEVIISMANHMGSSVIDK